MVKEQIAVQGMHCASCAAVIKRVLKKAPGVAGCEVNFGTETAEIEYDEQLTSPEELSESLRPLGYGLAVGASGPTGSRFLPDEDMASHSEHGIHPGMAESKRQKSEELHAYREKVEFVLPIALLVFALMLWEIADSWNSGFPKFFLPHELYNKLLLLLASAALFWAGRQFLRGLFNFLRFGAANMDTLIGIGTVAAYAYSAFAVLFPQAREALGLPETTFFDVTIVVIGFVVFGKYLEMRSKLKTGEAIEKLLNLQAKTALVLKEGKEIEVSISEVKVGDQIVVKPGAKLPVDGKVLEGASSVDDSMVTGEFMPKSVRLGDMVIGGTVNRQGSFVYEATKIGQATLLAQIIKMVQAAQGSKAPIESLADKISAVFVPVVLAVAVLSLAVWLAVGSRFMPFSQSLSFGLLCFVSVLVIACPCALGLATPTAVIVGVGRGAGAGILVKNAESLEKLKSVDVAVVDKTGTLTYGQPAVEEIIELPTSGMKSGELLNLAAALEAFSEHPLATAIVKKAREAGGQIPVAEGFANHEGRGVSGKVGGKEYIAGSPRFAMEQGAAADKGLLERLTLEGKTPVLVAQGKTLCGILAIADELKPDAREAVARLQELGVEVVMATGDHKNTAEHIAGQLGIKKVFAEILPQDKAMRVRELQSQGRVVAMVGDGINDAPALTQADVGIAMSTGTDIAIESADITLLHGDLAKFLSAIKLARSTVRAIRQNLFWAFVYNLVGIPLAAGVFYPFTGWLLSPVFAGAAMALSSVSVVANSLRLKQSKI